MKNQEKPTRVLVVAFAFGTPSTTKPNRRIGAVACELAREHGSAVFTQVDVPLADDVTYIPASEMPGDPPPTLRMCREAVHYARTHGITTIYVVAAYDHLRRVTHDLQLVQAEECWDGRVMRNFWKRGEVSVEHWFVPECTQLRTRNYRLWRMRERVLRLLMLWPSLYKRAVG